MVAIRRGHGRARRLTRRAIEGINSVRVRLARRARYRIVLTATDRAGNRSRTTVKLGASR
jgi:hypothetical protein